MFNLFKSSSVLDKSVLKPGELSTEMNISDGLLIDEVKEIRPNFKSVAFSDSMIVASWNDEK